MEATDKQLNYIIRLYNQVHDTSHAYLSQCKKLGLTQREARGGMTKAEASGHIDDLTAQLAARQT